jgi:hypothetical protein
MAAELTQQTFEAYLDQTFHIDLEHPTPIDLTLIEVKQFTVSPMDGRYKAIKAGEKRVPFALLFRGSRDLPLPQRIYPFVHPEMGAFDMSIVPVGIDDEGRFYEAVFN